jgi:hypothetical protein
MVGETMKIHNVDKEMVKQLALATARPGTTFLSGYVNGPKKYYISLDDALNDGREFLVSSRNDLEVFDIDQEYLTDTKDIYTISELLQKQNIKFVLVNSGTGFHLFVSLWSVPAPIGDIRKPFALKQAREWIIDFSKNFPLNKPKDKIIQRGESFTRTPLSPHRDKMPVSLIFPNTIEEAEDNLRYRGIFGLGIKNVSEKTFAMIRGQNKYATQGRSNTNQSLALSLANYGYTFEDFQWVVLNSQNVIKDRNIQRAKERNRTEQQIQEELERCWDKAITRYIARPPISVTRQQVNNWYQKALWDISKYEVHSKTKIRLFCLVTEIGLRAFEANSLEFTRSISRLHLDSQISEKSIYSYLQIVTQVCDLSISQDSSVKMLNVATTRFQLHISDLNTSLISSNQYSVLEPNYSYIKNGDSSYVNSFLSQQLPQTLYIDLGYVLDIWHPHDAWFATKISGGILGKLIWHLTQAMTEGTVEELCQLLEPNGNYISKTIIPRLIQANLLEIKNEKLKWIGDGEVLDSIALAGDVQGKQKKREDAIQKRRDDRAIAFEDYERRLKEQETIGVESTSETKFGTIEAQTLEIDTIQSIDYLEGF